jgi:hypothetical protein
MSHCKLQTTLLLPESLQGTKFVVVMLPFLGGKHVRKGATISFMLGIRYYRARIRVTAWELLFKLRATGGRNPSIEIITISVILILQQWGWAQWEPDQSPPASHRWFPAVGRFRVVALR